MYLNYFGLHTEPFSIAPDPQFLYLSERHQEALAHLSYGLSGSGGFILLTGEVGTGKTTVSRALLEQLPEHTQTAFILNPMLNSHELLATLCDEFGLQSAAQPKSRKDSASGPLTDKQLTDLLSKFLLSAHQAGQQCVVLIDEAQHLQPQVLEQLRLLTNLETNQQKLLRVILIGQPELQDLLRRRELRQLAQRITARYHLLPLQLADTERYINYRLQVAGAQRGLFERAAIQRVHQASEGIPRRLNLLCDRALLAAYNDQTQTVTVKHIKQAVLELDGAPAVTTNSRKWWILPAAAILGGVSAWLALYLMNQVNTRVSTDGLAATPMETTMEVSAPSESTPADSAAVPAIVALTQVWQLPAPPTEAAVCNWVEQFQLMCVTGTARMDQLKQLSWPLLLQLDAGQHQFVGSMATQPEAGWNGRFVAFIPQPPGYADEDSSLYQQWLAQQLKESGSAGEQPLVHQLRQVQMAAGLPVTGALDGITLAWLAANSRLGGPRLQEEQ